MSLLHRASVLLIFLTFLPPLPAKPPQVLAEFPIFSDGDVLLLPVQFSGSQTLLGNPPAKLCFASAFPRQSTRRETEFRRRRSQTEFGNEGVRGSLGTRKNGYSR
jgi:hypothetical protein